MNEYQFSDYSIFSNACNTVNNCISKVDETINSINQCTSSLTDGVFMGPIADNCKEHLNLSKEKMLVINQNFSSMVQGLNQISTTYQVGDQNADQTVDLGILGPVGATVSGNYLGNEYTLANTKANLGEYQKNVIQAKKVFQDADDEYGDWCLGFACVHAYGLYTNDTSIEARNCANGNPTTKNFKNYKTDDLRDFLNRVYNEISNGKPVVIQVNGSRSAGTRHFVTAVGFNKNVTSASELKDTDLLIVDSWDGKLENTVSKSAKSGRYVASGRELGRHYGYGYSMYTIEG